MLFDKALWENRGTEAGRTENRFLRPIAQQTLETELPLLEIGFWYIYISGPRWSWRMYRLPIYAFFVFPRKIWLHDLFTRSGPFSIVEKIAVKNFDLSRNKVTKKRFHIPNPNEIIT